MSSLTLVANAAVVTTQESGVDAIFSQASFGASPIDIRFGSIVTIENSSVIDIDSQADFNLLTDLAPNLGTAVNLFYVNSINWCGAPGANIAGCAEFPGSVLAVNSAVAAHAIYGAELIAHEMAHNLGFDHTAGPGLMGPTLNGQTTLSIDEVTILRSSPLVQMDASGSFINVTPILVQAAAVPEPSSLMLVSVVLIAMLGLQRGRLSAPAKAIELSGESPDRGTRYRPVADGNCVFNRKGGEQPKANEQSVTVL
ncbi:MAG: PEP-CTERM sorting domain-containing protein [Rhodopirellula sp. JB055]|uniref:PEP-CTERM sorting domain-containing protein n=1 Tax=Rhodopirellula sp. JB055 TaxID=3342846 RepID=UPI00370A78E6